MFLLCLFLCYPFDFVDIIISEVLVQKVPLAAIADIDDPGHGLQEHVGPIEDVEAVWFVELHTLTLIGAVELVVVADENEAEEEERTVLDEAEVDELVDLGQVVLGPNAPDRTAHDELVAQLNQLAFVVVPRRACLVEDETERAQKTVAQRSEWSLVHRLDRVLGYLFVVEVDVLHVDSSPGAQLHFGLGRFIHFFERVFEWAFEREVLGCAEKRCHFTRSNLSLFSSQYLHLIFATLSFVRGRNKTFFSMLFICLGSKT